MSIAQRHRSVLPGALLAAALVLAGACAPRQQPDLGDLQVSCPLARFVELGVEVDRVLVRFEPAEEGEYTELELEIDGNTATGAVALTPGTWYLTAELYEADETLVATGQATAVVLPGAVTQVRLRVSLVSGGIDVEVEWDEGPSLYIADISHRPAVVEIVDVGTFNISGLSRVGWDVQVIETVSEAGWIHKDPGVVAYPDVAMAKLRSSVEEVASLADWAANPVPRPVRLQLRGLGGESYDLALFDVLPVAADTGTLGVEFSDDVEMAGIRLSVGWIELLGHTPTFIELPPKPEPGQWVEIDGVDADLGWPNGVLVVPLEGTSDALLLPSVREGWNIFDWAKTTLQAIHDYGGVYPRNLSVINIDDTGYEINRRNVFFTWPASITLFNPERPYGESYLIDVLVVCDFVEDA